MDGDDPEAIDVFVREPDAQRMLADCLRDEPGWRDVLHIEPFKLEAPIRRTEGSLVPDFAPEWRDLTRFGVG